MPQQDSRHRWLRRYGVALASVVAMTAATLSGALAVAPNSQASSVLVVPVDSAGSPIGAASAAVHTVLPNTGAVTGQVAVAARFPGDPGIDKIWLGLNDVSGYRNVEAHLPHPLGIHRVYNGNNWGVPMSAVSATINDHQIPYVSWKLAPYTVSTVPQSAINAACTNLKSFRPHPLWVTIFHEPEDDLTTSAQAAAYRALFRNVVHTCDAMGVDNVAFTEPTFQAPFTFGTASGRNPAWWEPDWKGTSTGTSADWYTGKDRVIDILSIDSYIPLFNSNNWQSLSTTLNLVKKRWTALGMPLANRPWAVAEQGVKSDLVTPDLTRGPNAMQAVYDTALANNFVGISWWTSGADSFCHGPVPKSDPGCHREQKLAALVNDPRTAHP
jgi:hypothetical protein